MKLSFPILKILMWGFNVNLFFCVQNVNRIDNVVDLRRFVLRRKGIQINRNVKITYASFYKYHVWDCNQKLMQTSGEPKYLPL